MVVHRIQCVWGDYSLLDMARKTLVICKKNYVGKEFRDQIIRSVINYAEEYGCNLIRPKGTQDMGVP